MVKSKTSHCKVFFHSTTSFSPFYINIFTISFSNTVNICSPLLWEDMFDTHIKQIQSYHNIFVWYTIKIKTYNVILGTFTGILLQFQVFWDVMPYWLKLPNDVLKDHGVLTYVTLKIQALRFLKSLITIYQLTHHNNAEDLYLQE